MIFRQLFDLTSSTYTYLLACGQTRQAILIDPVFEQTQRDLALIRELNLTLVGVVDTHCHADHVTAAWSLKQLTGAHIGSAEIIGAESVDWPLSDGDSVPFGSETLHVIATPGHTDGCLTFVTDDKAMAFTGDALLIRGCGRCDFQQGNAQTLYQSITQRIFSLPPSCALYPGHDYSGKTSSTVDEEKAFNARLGGGASEHDFVAYMNNLKLPHPKLIDHAVPANLISGRPTTEAQVTQPDWAPIQMTFSGIPEVTVEWAQHHQQELTVLDVRDAFELESPEDQLSGATSIPLSDLRERIDELDPHQPTVCMCRSGRRSSMAVTILQKAGFKKVANVSGGLLRWRDFS